LLLKLWTLLPCPFVASAQYVPDSATTTGSGKLPSYTGFRKPVAEFDSVEMEGLFEGAAGEVPLVEGPALQATRTARAPTAPAVDQRRSGLTTKPRPTLLSP
jgi:hypothetical protein